MNRKYIIASIIVLLTIFGASSFIVKRNIVNENLNSSGIEKNDIGQVTTEKHKYQFFQTKV